MIVSQALPGRSMLPTRGLQAASPSEPRDTVEVSQPRDGSPARAAGAIGAASGATLGSIAVPVASAGTAYAVASSLMGPLGSGLVAVGGFIGGMVLEGTTGVGRLVGAMTGGAVGEGVGYVAGHLGWQPSERLAHTTRNFSLKELPARLRSETHTSNEPLSRNPEAVKAVSQLISGDIVLVQDENYFLGGAHLQKLGGCSSNYTHMGIVTERGTVLEIGVPWRERTVDNLLTFTNLAVLRPNYQDQATVDNLLTGLRETRKHVRFDPRFSLKSDDAQYCGEFIYKGLKQWAPDIKVDTRKILGFEFVTADEFLASPDMDLVYDSGSNFWLNHLSRFS
ncbi:MAG: hypothetical protein AB1758_21435 [Candidatus Eremiobacterota bacterium]